ncbi:MAG: AI-2E family transporter [Longimicrobiales bacterium]
MGCLAAGIRLAASDRPGPLNLWWRAPPSPCDPPLSSGLCSSRWASWRSPGCSGRVARCCSLQLEGNLLMPLVMRGTVHLPPALTVLFQSFMALIFGFLGLLVAVPLLAAALVAVKSLYVEPLEASDG